MLNRYSTKGQVKCPRCGSDHVRCRKYYFNIIGVVLCIILFLLCDKSIQSFIFFSSLAYLSYTKLRNRHFPLYCENCFHVYRNRLFAKYSKDTFGCPFCGYDSLLVKDIKVVKQNVWFILFIGVVVTKGIYILPLLYVLAPKTYKEFYVCSLCNSITPVEREKHKLKRLILNPLFIVAIMITLFIFVFQETDGVLVKSSIKDFQYNINEDTELQICGLKNSKERNVYIQSSYTFDDIVVEVSSVNIEPSEDLEKLIIDAECEVSPTVLKSSNLYLDKNVNFAPFTSIEEYRAFQNELGSIRSPCNLYFGGNLSELNELLEMPIYQDKDTVYTLLHTIRKTHNIYYNSDSYCTEGKLYEY